MPTQKVVYKLIEALFISSKSGDHPNVHQLMDRKRVAESDIEMCYRATNKNGVPQHTIARMNPKSIMTGE